MNILKIVESGRTSKNILPIFASAFSTIGKKGQKDGKEGEKRDRFKNSWKGEQRKDIKDEKKQTIEDIHLDTYLIPSSDDDSFEAPEKVTPRQLHLGFIGWNLCVEGIVTRCCFTRAVRRVRFCPTTKQFVVQQHRLKTGLLTGHDEYQQIISVQDAPESVARGQRARTVDIVVEDENAGIFLPGDRVSAFGVFNAISNFRAGLIANDVSPVQRMFHNFDYCKEEIQKITKISDKVYALDKLGNLVAHSGDKWIKNASILLMMGEHDSINMMMVGNRSVATSQLLRAIRDIAPLGILTTGRGFPGIGLTASFTHYPETGDQLLKGGAMVLADRGIVCIDEFENINDQDRIAIQDAVKRQKISIAGACLSTRCTIFASANLIYGAYNHSVTPAMNVGLPESVLDVFDMVFVVGDQMDPGVDHHNSENVSDGKGSGRSRKRADINFLKKYIHYARSRPDPVLTDEAIEYITNEYLQLRLTGSKAKTEGKLPITGKTFHTIIRLATAHAKVRLRTEVQISDVKAALKVLYHSIYH